MDLQMEKNSKESTTQGSSVPTFPRPRGARPKSLAARMRESDHQAPVSHGFIRSFDGSRIFYSVEGRPDGKPLIFCYGLVCSSLHWTYQIDHFAHSHRAVWTDYRGHQNSDTPADLGTITIENMAHDLRIVMDELGIQDAVLLGHSMGVNVVLEFYRQNPHRVAGMVLANGTAKRPLETAFHANVLDKAFEALRAVHDLSPTVVNTIWKLQNANPFTRTLVALGGFNPHLTPKEDIQIYVDQVASMKPEILLQLIRNYQEYDATAWLHTIRAPTLIIAGDEDHMIPREQQELLHQLIPGSELEILRHGSHCPQMDLPELFNMKIERFLEKIRYQ
jgi:non-heme chloroperoxidase